MKVEVDRYKVNSGGARTCSAANNRHKFMWFNATFCVEIDCARPSVSQARCFSLESIGSYIRRSWVRIPC